MNAQLFVSKYQLYLPDSEEFRQQLEKILVLERNAEADVSWCKAADVEGVARPKEALS